VGALVSKRWKNIYKHRNNSSRKRRTMKPRLFNQSQRRKKVLRRQIADLKRDRRTWLIATISINNRCNLMRKSKIKSFLSRKLGFRG